MNSKPCKDCGAENCVLNGGRCRLCSGGNLVYQQFGTGGQEASNLINRLVRKGLLKSPRQFDCVDCGKRACDYDHRDYNKPLDVVPVCRSCNAARGAAIPKAMSFREFMLAVCESNRFADYPDIIFERLRQRYWPNDPEENGLRNQPKPSHRLLDAILAETEAQHDAHIADAIGIKPFMVRRIRIGKKPVSSDIVLKIHEAFGLPVDRIRQLVQGVSA